MYEGAAAGQPDLVRPSGPRSTLLVTAAVLGLFLLIVVIALIFWDFVASLIGLLTS